MYRCCCTCQHVQFHSIRHRQSCTWLQTNRTAKPGRGGADGVVCRLKGDKRNANCSTASANNQPLVVQTQQLQPSLFSPPAQHEQRNSWAGASCHLRLLEIWTCQDLHSKPPHSDGGGAACHFNGLKQRLGGLRGDF